MSWTLCNLFDAFLDAGLEAAIKAWRDQESLTRRREHGAAVKPKLAQLAQLATAIMAGLRGWPATTTKPATEGILEATRGSACLAQPSAAPRPLAATGCRWLRSRGIEPPACPCPGIRAWPRSPRSRPRGLAAVRGTAITSRY